MRQNIFHQKLVDKLKPLRKKEVDHVWINFHNLRIKFVLPPEEDSFLHEFMIFKYKGKLKIAPFEYGKEPYGARYKNLILGDRLIAVSEVCFEICDDEKIRIR